ncbi:hypothetical protein RRG08_025198 [Elysia crispata]|uniref:Ankyrin repeat domain-containing protein 54 n=1 Tax=Elysia crispata TaxID=231223 RepID=A0AAE1AC68_9GAST|nr:hypothetical protein RRG08_025198 [Elysia crispata]
MEADLIDSSDEDVRPSSSAIPTSILAASSFTPYPLSHDHSAHHSHESSEEVDPSICASCPSCVDPPRQETVQFQTSQFQTPRFNFDGINPLQFNMAFPVTMLPSGSYEPSAQSTIKSTIKDSHSCSHGSACCGKLKAARRQSLNRIGVASWSGEKKFLAAVRNNDLCKVIHLLDGGINPNVSDSRRRTALHIAASQGLDQIVSCLTARRADPNKIDHLGNSPLHLAACRGDTRVVRILLGSGADIYKKDDIGRTALEIVKSRLNMLRQDKSISADKLIGECQMICDLLRIHTEKFPSGDSSQVDALCNMMAHVSTREQADQCADAMLNQVSSLNLGCF